MTVPQPSTDSEVIAARLEESDVSTKARYCDVADGEKVCYGDHTDPENRRDTPPGGNYGVYLTAVDTLVVLDVDDYDEDGLPFDLPETLVEESPHGGEHIYYHVPVDDDGRMPAAVFDGEVGTKNPVPSWGEVQVANKYIVGAGSELDECGKDWHDCSADDEGAYTVKEDREIATVSAERLVEVLLSDPDLEEPSPTPDAGSSDGGHADDVDLDVHDVLFSSSYPAGERTEHPVHGSSTGTNFAVDGGAETWRCWRHGTTGNALHLIGMEEGVIDCGEWDNGGLSTETWRDIFAAAREAGYDVGDPLGQDVDEPDYSEDVETGRDLIDLAREPVQEVFRAKNATEEDEVEQIDKKTAIHRFAEIIDTYWHWIHPPASSGEWINKLHVYDPDRGVYRPDGETQAKGIIEDLLGSFAGRHEVREIVSKIKRRNQLAADEADSLKPPADELVVKNGILNLSTGDLREYTPEAYHTVRVDVEYDPSAETERIDEFFHEIVSEDDVATLYRLAAHTLRKDYPSRKAALLVGEGANGKGTLLNLFQEFVGKENTVARGLQRLAEYPFAVQDLHGKLANLEGDLSPSELSDSRMVKKLTGDDEINADVKQSNETIDFQNYASLMFAVNTVPQSPEDSHGWWSRWMYIQFPHRFDGDDGVPKEQLMSELTREEELKGLLARCVEENKRYAETGEFFPSSGDPDEVREQILNAANPVRDFATTAFQNVSEPDGEFGRVRKDSVVDAYSAYADENNLPGMNPQKLKEKVGRLSDFDIEAGQARSLADSTETMAQVFNGVEWTPRGRQLAGLDEPEDDDQDSLADVEMVEDTPVREIRQFVEENSEADVYEVMREFTLGGEAFDDVQRVIDCVDDSEDEETDDDSDGLSHSEEREARSFALDTQYSVERIVELCSGEEELVREIVEDVRERHGKPEANVEEDDIEEVDEEPDGVGARLARDGGDRE